MSSTLIVLRAGMVIPIAAYVLAITLEARGVRLTLDGPDIVIDGDVTDDEYALLKRWKPHVRMLIAHVADDRHVTRLHARPRREVQHA